MSHAILPINSIEKRIFHIRGHRVLLDTHLATLYGVSTKRLKEQVRRNRSRFPGDFMFELTAAEFADLRSQFATSSEQWGGPRYRPFAFTEQGVAMLSTVLKSQKAIRVNIEIMRAFVKLRELTSTHKELSSKLAELERKYDSQFRTVFEAIRHKARRTGPPTHATASETETQNRILATMGRFDWRKVLLTVISDRQ